MLSLFLKSFKIFNYKQKEKKKTNSMNKKLKLTQLI